MVSELEKLLPLSANSRQDWASRSRSADDLLRSIPAAIQNMSDLFKYASAKIASLHDRIEAAREQHVEKLRQARLCPALDQISSWEPLEEFILPNVPSCVQGFCPTPRSAVSNHVI